MYFVGHVADWGEAWALTHGDNGASITDDGKRYLPLWPHPEYAKENLEGDWLTMEIAPIAVDDLLDVLASLAELGDGVALFRRKEGDFITVPPEPLKADLQTALDEIR